MNLIVEVTGEKKKDKAAKVATARTCGCPPSTTTAASAAGSSSKSPIPGMHKTPFEAFCLGWRRLLRLTVCHI